MASKDSPTWWNTTYRGVVRVFREIFPFLDYYRLAKRKNCKLFSLDGDSPDQDLLSLTRDYERLSSDMLNSRLLEEHDRSTLLDEKTYRYATVLPVVLAIGSIIVGVLASHIPELVAKLLVSIISAMSIFYLLAGVLLALESIRLRPKFGIGTRMLLEKMETQNLVPLLAKNLVQQEEINIVRQVRNEVVFLTIRNGLVCLCVVLVLAILVLGFERASNDILDAPKFIPAVVR